MTTATLYRAVRQGAGWAVVCPAGADLEVVKEFGAGPASAAAAQKEAERLNRQKPPAALALHAWRKAHGLTQTQLADKLGVVWLTVQRWESGQRSVPPYLHLALKYLEEHP